jgi:hypothetical protein
MNGGYGSGILALGFDNGDHAQSTHTIEGRFRGGASRIAVG